MEPRVIGRYRVDGVLGRGGMGVVYAGWDPDLQRRVAVKVLGDETLRSGAARLLREARAMAKLSHPNVITVYEVGSHDGRVFIAMELVEGETLAEWLHGEHEPAEVLRMFIHAGHGLAAAHAAGLVHRDFKPSNVLVRRDGRPLVTDFGLARRDIDSRERTPRPPPSDSELAALVRVVANLGEDDTASAPTVPDPAREGEARPSDRTIEDELTRTGAVLGTPGYMAPEQYRGEADARTDQFAFCLALWEALAGERPFARGTSEIPEAAGLKPTGHLPVRLRTVLARGLAREPADRWPSLDDVLRRIEPRSRATWMLGAAAVVALGAAGVVAWTARGPAPCSGIDARLVGVWDASARETVRRAFADTKLAYADHAYSALARALDARAVAWSAAVTESCRATRIRGEQPDEIFALRQACFDDRLGELRALVGVLAHADPGIVDKADRAVTDLDPISRCANVAALRQQGRPPLSIEAAVGDLQRDLAGAKAQLIAGHFLPTLVATQQIIDRAVALHWDPIASEALRARATALFSVGNTDDAIGALEQATWAAMRGKRDDIVASSALSIGMLTAEQLGKPDAARVWIDLGTAAATRYGDDPALAVTLHHCAAVAAAAGGDLNAALAQFDQMWHAAAAEYGDDSSALAWLESDFAATLTRAGACGQAVPHYERAIALASAALGSDHAEVVKIESNLGLCYHHLGEIAKARATLERALAIREKQSGKTSPILVASLDNLAEVLSEQGDHAAAIAMVERALALAAVLPGRSHPVYHQVATDAARIQLAAGAAPVARTLLETTIALETATKSPVLPTTRTALARVALVQQRWDEAAQVAGEAIAGYEAEGGAMQPELWEPLTARAQAELAHHDLAAARASLERALAIATHAHVSEHDLAATREALAKANAK